MSSEENASIAKKTVQGSVYSIAASGTTIVLGFIRITLMLRYLRPEDFGLAALALFYLDLAAQIREFGVDNAFIHRKDSAQKTVSTYFTLRMGTVLLTLVILAALAPLLGRLYPEYPSLNLVLWAYIGISVFKTFNGVQETILSKELAFRKLALVDVSSSIVMTIVAPYLAWRGWGVWSIVAERLSGILTRTLLIWIFYRAWRPRIGWDGQTVRWFLNYGARAWTSSTLTYLVDRFDDFWIGTFLGSAPLGFYSRAYEYARYPRRVIANPVLSVFFPTFARLQDDRLRLSRAFFRATSLMIRAGFLFSLAFILTAPEFIRLLLTDRWLPMLMTFQLMIVYTLLDPLSMSAANLLMATGHPGTVTRVRFLQALIFVPAVIGFGSLAGIEGVALAADLMILVGALLLFRQTMGIIQYSQRALWLWPVIALAITAVTIILLNPLWAALPMWGALLGKLAFISLLYTGILWLAEREQLLIGWRMIWGMVNPRAKKA